MKIETLPFWWGLKQDLYSCLSYLSSSFARTLMIMGHLRAAAELTRMGYHDQANRIRLELEEMRNGR